MIAVVTRPAGLLDRRLSKIVKQEFSPAVGCLAETDHVMEFFLRDPD